MNEDVQKIKALRAKLNESQIMFCDDLVLEFAEEVSVLSKVEEIEALRDQTIAKLEKSDHHNDDAHEFLESGIMDVCTIMGKECRVPA